MSDTTSEARRLLKEMAGQWAPMALQYATRGVLGPPPGGAGFDADSTERGLGAWALAYARSTLLLARTEPLLMSTRFPEDVMEEGA